MVYEDNAVGTLTERQQEVLDYIVDYIARTDVFPRLTEIGTAMGISSKNGVWEHLDALVRKKWLIRYADYDAAKRRYCLSPYTKQAYSELINPSMCKVDKIRSVVRNIESLISFKGLSTPTQGAKKLGSRILHIINEE